MGLKDWFDKDARALRGVQKHTRRASNRNAQSEERLDSLQALAELANQGVEGALDGVLRRFEMTADKGPEDTREKQFAREILEEFGPDAVPAVQGFLAHSENVVWPIEVLRKICKERQVVGLVLEALGDEIDRDTVKPVKKLRLMEHLTETSDPRVVEPMIRALQDFDETVRLRAMDVLFSLGDERAREPLLALLVDEDLESDRLRRTLVAGFVAQQWAVTGFRAQVEAVLDERHHVDRSGRIQRAGGG